MKFSGTALLPGTPQQVWDLLTDPRRLEKLLPGCERLEPDGPGRYKAAIKFGIAAISGNYSGAIVFSDEEPPNSLRLGIEGKGTPGFVKGQGELTLAAKEGQTEVAYTGDAQVGGLIASVGQRMIEATAKKIIQQFFESAAKDLSGKQR